MKTKMFATVLALLVGASFSVQADPNDSEMGSDRATHNGLRVEQKERLVFVTGSHIPKKVKIKSIGTNTVSNMRVIDRSEIDATSGANQTARVIALDPAVSVRGH
jgi:hypothetical protein